MIVIIGSPGAGKSVQAELLEKEGLAKWLSMGKLLRAGLSGELKTAQASGDLIDDELTVNILLAELLKIDLSQPVILDGFPRKITQVEWLMSDENNRGISGVILIDIPEEEAVDRLLQRNREDDKASVIKHRYQLFHHDNKAILDCFKENGVTIEVVDGHGSIEEVHDRVKLAFGRLNDRETVN